jgi:hypothetical protein
MNTYLLKPVFIVHAIFVVIFGGILLTCSSAESVDNMFYETHNLPTPDQVMLAHCIEKHYDATEAMATQLQWFRRQLDITLDALEYQCGIPDSNTVDVYTIPYVNPVRQKDYTAYRVNPSAFLDPNQLERLTIELNWHLDIQCGSRIGGVEQIIPQYINRMNIIKKHLRK